MGGDGVESSVVAGKAPRQPPKDIRLVLWKEGFTLDDEPLRRYDDPANKTFVDLSGGCINNGINGFRFLDQITNGELPTELRHLGREVNVSMEDRRNDDYEENKPKPTFKSFGGGGNRLGSDTPSTSSTAASTSATTGSAATAKSDISVDPSQPTTKLRLRLCNGKQLVQGDYYNTLQYRKYRSVT